jgi:hypothetical protein
MTPLNLIGKLLGKSVHGVRKLLKILETPSQEWGGKKSSSNAPLRRVTGSSHGEQRTCRRISCSLLDLKQALAQWY